MTPILVGKVCVGVVEGQVFHKNVIGSKHMLRRPPAWAFDLETLDQAEQAGARWVRVRDAETGREYEAAIAYIRAKGFDVNRGHGRQVALPLGEWKLKAEGELVQEEMWG